MSTKRLIVRGKGKKIDRPGLAVLPHKRFRSIWRRAIPSESFAAWPRRGAEPSQRRALLRDNHKLIANLWGDVAVYDLKSDPMEVINLAN